MITVDGNCLVLKILKVRKGKERARKDPYSHAGKQANRLVLRFGFESVFRYIWIRD